MKKISATSLVYLRNIDERESAKHIGAKNVNMKVSNLLQRYNNNSRKAYDRVNLLDGFIQ